jgi:hypothetical protein
VPDSPFLPSVDALSSRAVEEPFELLSLKNDGMLCRCRCSAADPSKPETGGTFGFSHAMAVMKRI